MFQARIGEKELLVNGGDHFARTPNKQTKKPPPLNRSLLKVSFHILHSSFSTTPTKIVAAAVLSVPWQVNFS